MRFPGMLYLVALLGLGIAAAVLMTYSSPLGVKGGRVDLSFSDLPPSKVWADEHGNWMQYFFWQGQLRWMVIARGVEQPDRPADDDTRPAPALYSTLKVAGTEYPMSGARNFYTLSPEGLTPAAHLVISLNFYRFLDRLYQERHRKGSDFNVISVTKDFWKNNRDLRELLEELEAQ